MKRILHIISQYPGKTGSGTYLQALIYEGSKKGYKQGLIAALPEGKQYKNKYIDDFYPIYFNNDRLPFPIVGMSDIMPYDSTKYCDMTEGMITQYEGEFCKIIKNAILDFKPDIILSHHLWLTTSLVTNIANGIKVIGICHGTDIRQFESCDRFKEKVIEGCNKLDLVFALSESQKEVIKELYKIKLDKIKVIGGGYNKDIFYADLNNKQKHEKIKLIYAGKLSFAKGLVPLIQVFKNLSSKYNIELYIAGSGTGEEEDYIRKLGNNDNIHFLGEVSQKDLGDLFRKSDIFVLPSFYEGLSLVTIEALACGLLAVVTDIPSLRYVLGEEIVNSGIIRFVTLPEMIGVDKPKAEARPKFNNNLEKALELQINRYIDGYKLDSNLLNIIERNSWEEIYNKINGYLEEKVK